ncbi:MAG: LCP family protein [Clostridia bacterium]|nr:LCP family protein [Clostridia bacterium]MBQ8400010.1 LCP family protein [Clostridia bacterium]
MKKFLSLFLAMLMVCTGFVGCNSQMTTEDTDTHSKDTSSPESSVAPPLSSPDAGFEDANSPAVSVESPEDSTPAPSPSAPDDPSESPSQTNGINTTLTLDELKALWEILKQEQITEGDAISKTEQVEIEQQIKDALAANKDPISDKDVYNVLLIGYDGKASAGYAKNSDTMMIISINFKAKTFTMTSLLRDSYVLIPEIGYNRLNAAYAVKGYPLLKKTIENNFGIVIDNYVALSFSAFVTFYDALGGMDVNITTQKQADILTERMKDYYKAYAPAGYPVKTDPIVVGMNHLDGVQLLIYARDRSSTADTDFGRTKRQRALIGDTVKKMTSMSVTELYDLMELMLPLVTTDIPANECSSLLMKLIASNVFAYKQQSMRIPAENTWQNKTVTIGKTKQGVLSMDLAANTKKFMELVYGIKAD